MTGTNILPREFLATAISCPFIISYEYPNGSYIAGQSGTQNQLKKARATSTGYLLAVNRGSYRHYCSSL